LNNMGLKDENWHLYLPVAPYSSNTILGPMFQGFSCYEAVYGFCTPEFVRFTRNSPVAEHVVRTSDNFEVRGPMLLKPLFIKFKMIATIDKIWDCVNKWKLKRDLVSIFQSGVGYS
jgi:hypothetical protein